MPDTTTTTPSEHLPQIQAFFDQQYAARERY
jgi:hypothetical protein